MYACPDQEQLGRLCTNASISVTAMVAKRIKGRAVLVDMRADWRPWYVLVLPATFYYSLLTRRSPGVVELRMLSTYYWQLFAS